MSQKKVKQQRKEQTKRRDLRIIWAANSPHANSGYSVFTRDLLFRLAKDGWPVANIGTGAGVDAYPVYMYGEDLIDERFKGVKVKVYPKLGDPYGGDSLLPHSGNFGAHILFTMADVWVYPPQVLSQFRAFIPYAPIDKYPVPQNVLEKLQYAYKIITFSKFGQQSLEENGFTSSLILEGTDTEIFKPLNKPEIRNKFKIPQDAFLFGMIAANKENPPRKGFQQALEAFKLFHDKHPEAAMFFHSQQQSPTGFPIQHLTKELGVGARCFFLDDYTGMFNSRSHDVAEEMNMLDVLLHPSLTEGFGLTVVEAASCGIPAIVNDTTSMPEMIIPGKTGEICKTGHKFFTQDGTWIYTGDVQDIYEKMEILYKKLHEPNTMAEDCRNHVLKNYNVDTLYETKWKPLVESLQVDLLGESDKMDPIDRSPKK